MVESYVTVGAAPCFTNPVVEIILGDGAELEHCKIQMESRDCFHIATIRRSKARTAVSPHIPFPSAGELRATTLRFSLPGKIVIACSMGSISAKMNNWSITIRLSIMQSRAVKATNFTTVFLMTIRAAFLTAKFLCIRTRKKPMPNKQIETYCFRTQPPSIPSPNWKFLPTT